MGEIFGAGAVAATALCAGFLAGSSPQVLGISVGPRFLNEAPFRIDHEEVVLDGDFAVQGAARSSMTRKN